MKNHKDKKKLTGRQMSPGRAADFQYEWTDTWLLLSIAIVGRREPASLYGIIMTGDVINHAIFNEEEVESGLCRLVKGGWIHEEDGKFTVTNQFREGKVDLSRSRDVVWRQVETLLGAKPYEENSSPSLCKKRQHYPGFSSTEWKEALEKYREESSKILRVLSKKRRKCENRENRGRAK